MSTHTVGNWKLVLLEYGSYRCEVLDWTGDTYVHSEGFNIDDRQADRETQRKEGKKGIRERRGEGRRRDADVSAELHMNCVQAHECTQLFPISVLGDSIGQNTDIQELTSISST